MDANATKTEDQLQHETGWGGSYAQDEQGRNVQLVQRTDTAAPYRPKQKPLRNDKGELCDERGRPLPKDEPQQAAGGTDETPAE